MLHFFPVPAMKISTHTHILHGNLGMQAMTCIHLEQLYTLRYKCILMYVYTVYTILIHIPLNIPVKARGRIECG